MGVGFQAILRHPVVLITKESIFSFPSRMRSIYWEGPLGKMHLLLLICGLVPLLLYGIFVARQIQMQRVSAKHMNPKLVAQALAAAKLKARRDLFHKGYMKEKESLVLELIHTDNAYLGKLQMCKDRYINIIAARKFLSPAELELQFCEWDTMIDMHTHLRTMLKKVSRHGGTNVMWKALLDFAPQLQIYSKYADKYLEAQAARGEIMRTNNKFTNLIFDLDNAINSTAILEELLSAPLQRVQEYLEFYNQFLELTIRYGKKEAEFKAQSRALDDDSVFDEKKEQDNAAPDLQQVEKAIVMLREIENHQHFVVSWAERAKIFKVMSSFTQATRINLVDNPYRKLIHEGVLKKQCRKAVKTYTFWLFSDKLLYGEATGQIVGLGKKEYKLHRVIDLVSSRIAASTDKKVKDRERALLIECPAKSFIVWAPTIKDLLTWSDRITACTKSVREEYEAYHDFHAPVWVPDTECKSCLICHKVFTFFHRRHHCRNCGKLVCHKCSSRGLIYAELDSKHKLRTCDDCFGKLSDPNSPESTLAKRSLHTYRHGRSASTSGMYGNSGKSEPISPLTDDSSMAYTASSPDMSILTDNGTEYSMIGTTPPASPLIASSPTVSAKNTAAPQSNTASGRWAELSDHVKNVHASP